MEELSEKFWQILSSRLATCPCGILDTLDSQPNEPLSDETDIGEQEDDYNNNHSSTSAADGSTYIFQTILTVVNQVEVTLLLWMVHLLSIVAAQVAKNLRTLQKDGSWIKGKKRKRSKGKWWKMSWQNNDRRIEKQWQDVHRTGREKTEVWRKAERREAWITAEDDLDIMTRYGGM